jgi:hypothetical protein
MKKTRQRARPARPAKTATKAPPTALVTRPGAGPNSLVTITPRGCALIARSFAEGLTYMTVAKALGISGKTLQECRKRSEAVDEAWAAGNAALEDELTNILLTHARNKSVVAAIYLTKVKCGWREGDQPEARANITIVLPDAHTPEAYMRLVGASSSAEPGATVPPALLPGPKVVR